MPYLKFKAAFVNSKISICLCKMCSVSLKFPSSTLVYQLKPRGRLRVKSVKVCVLRLKNSSRTIILLNLCISY